MDFGDKLTRGQKIMIIRMVATVVMVVGFYFVPVTGVVKFLLYLIPYFFVGEDEGDWWGFRGGASEDSSFSSVVELFLEELIVSRKRA